MKCEDILFYRFSNVWLNQVLDLQTYEARQKEYASRGHKHFYFMTLNGSEVCICIPEIFSVNFIFTSNQITCYIIDNHASRMWWPAMISLGKLWWFFQFSF